MEEKERYEIHIYDDICVDLYDNGVLDKSINDTYKLEELLNKQSKRIKELEEQTYPAYKREHKRRAYLENIELPRLEKENQQLREDLQAKDILVNTYMSVVGTLDNAKQLKQAQKEFAIAKLEKVKENIKKVPITDFDLSGNFEKIYKQDAIRQIDNQIKKLK